VRDAVWDPGFSLCRPGTTAYPLADGIDQTLQLVTHQRGFRPFAGEAMVKAAKDQTLLRSAEC